ncbi:Probable RNA-directed DNA polymerase from transposon X-element [Eumeta japonica]|uniref:Probable RNA-directed DNA polymerase from transposon X-element n=1 Tax=Eumeta variegata TaxID=151549 RepID=A0A4C1YHF0_EUMVA|nr:Probable RNA-directed DNA polymerase from transposon X-element [Eumeta japonica]
MAANGSRRYGSETVGTYDVKRSLRRTRGLLCVPGGNSSDNRPFTQAEGSGTGWDFHYSHRQLPRRAMMAMTRFFNGILGMEYFPGCWKKGRVIAIPKAGKDIRLASSQRPIMLLSHIAKLFGAHRAATPAPSPDA